MEDLRPALDFFGVGALLLLWTVISLNQSAELTDPLFDFLCRRQAWSEKQAATVATLAGGVLALTQLWVPLVIGRWFWCRTRSNF